MKQKYQFEVCANSLESAWNAYRGGANRVELCANLNEGGITPSVGMMHEARCIPSLVCHVLIRPRGGDFVYNDYEVQTMLQDIRAAKEQKMDGVVIGALNPDGSIDLKTMQKLLKAAVGMSVTFHRAFDLCKNPFEALQQIILMGCDRLLTSGQGETAEIGIPLLKELNEIAQNKISIMPGCGVNESNIYKIANETGLHEFHFSASENRNTTMTYFNEKAKMGVRDVYTQSVSSRDKIFNTIHCLLDA